MITEKKILDGNLLKTVKSQDVSQILDYNKHLAETHKTRGDLKHVASIPLILAEEWQRQSGHNIGSKEYAEFVKQRLNDGGWNLLRVWKGKL